MTSDQRVGDQRESVFAVPSVDYALRLRWRQDPTLR